MKRLCTLLALLAWADANAIIVSYNLSRCAANSTVGSVYTTAFPAGNAPISGGSACTNWTCATKGDAAGEIDEVSASSLTFNATGGSNIFQHNYAYQLCADTGDCQVTATLPASYGGFNGSFSSFGAVISEGTGDAAYVAKVWCPVTGSVRCTTGTPSSNSTSIGTAGACFSKQLALTYDVSATDLICMESSDGVTWTQVGSTVDKTLSCVSDCPAGVWGSADDASQTTTATVTAAAVATTISITPEAPAPGVQDNIIWSGDYETGNFLQWHFASDDTRCQFSQMPSYGRPTDADCGAGNTNPDSYFGDGSLLSIVTAATGEVRQGTYAAKFTVKNSINGSEPADCDVPFPTCTRRRTDLTMQHAILDFYGGMAYGDTNWFSFSTFIPADWDAGGSGFGPILYDIKGTNENGSSGAIAFEVEDGDHWVIWHRWNNDGGTIGQVEWQKQMFYSGNWNGSPYPRTNAWPDGMAHFPDVATSYAALQSVNIGGWTDWIGHVKWDATPAGSGGTGFLKIYKREDSGAWVQVLDIFPGFVTRGGQTFDHGIGYNQTGGGFGPKLAFYMDKNQVWGLAANRVIYHDNIKIGNASATCSDMTSDGSDCTQ